MLLIPTSSRREFGRGEVPDLFSFGVVRVVALVKLSREEIYR